MSYLDVSLAALERFEGRVAWMYLDSVGLVTVGVGNMLPDWQSAAKLPFRLPQSSDLASASDVQLCWQRVKAMAPKHSAGYYQEYESLVLKDEDITEMLRGRVVEFEASLRMLFAGYDGFPDAAKVGLIDMIYNLGEARLKGEYPKFCAAVNAKNWAAAAIECHREGPSVERNTWTEDQFVEAA